MQAENILTDFVNIKHLEHTHMSPVHRKQNRGPDKLKCAELLQVVYTAGVKTSYSSSCTVPKFTFQELQYAIQSMKKRKCADNERVVFEMLWHGGNEIVACL